MISRIQIKTVLYGDNYTFVFENYLQMTICDFCLFIFRILCRVFNNVPAFLKNSMFYVIFFDKTARSFKNAPLFLLFFSFERVEILKNAFYSLSAFVSLQMSCRIKTAPIKNIVK